MSKLYKYISFFLVLLPFASFAQQVTNIRFEQSGKKIHIYYDLLGEGTYNVKVYCSTNNGQTWGEPLQKVTGAVGENQQLGTNKEIIWDVLAEREELTEYVMFKLIAILGGKGTFTDPRDGQTYKWVKIGNQVWMAENLNYKTKNSWCYDYALANCGYYGRLYERVTIMSGAYSSDEVPSGVQGICPPGWHIPSITEWDILVHYLGGSDIAGGKMKENGTTHWNRPNTGAANKSGFTALPSGYRDYSGSFVNMGSYCTWWSATANGSTRAWHLSLDYDGGKVGRYYIDKEYGFSVRCVRD